MNTIKNNNLLVTSVSFPNIDNTYIGGIFIKEQLSSVLEKISEVNVIAPVIRRWGLLDKDPKRFDYSYNNVKIFFPKAFYLPRGRIKRFTIDKWQQGVRKAITDNNVEFDLIHAHFGIMGRSCVKISQEHKKPLITSFYGYDAYRNTYDSQYYKILFEKGSLFLTLSDHMSKQLEKLGCPKHKIKKIHLGINIDLFQPKLEQKTVEDNKVIKILLVANFVEKKGIFDAIKAYARVSRNTKSVHFDLVGRGPLQNQLESLITSLGLQNRIKITDNQSTLNPRKTVLSFMQNCDIFMLPSVTSSNGDSEGTPVVLMEASACGKPCITTFHSGNPEIVMHNKTGLAVPERDINGLEKALNILILNEDLRKQYGLNARNYICNEFNSSNQSKLLIRMYEEVLGNH